MNNLSIIRIAKGFVIVAVIFSSELLSAEERPVDLFFSVLSSRQYNEAVVGEKILWPDSLIMNEYSDLILLAAAKADVKTAKRKKPEITSPDTENAVSVAVKAVYLIPLGDWKDLIKQGYGGMLELCFNDLFFKGSRPGIETGYIYSSGKVDTVKKEYIVPVFAALGYEIFISPGIGIVPKFSAGGGYFNVSYTPAGSSSKTKSESEFELMAKGGMSITYDLSKTITIEAGAEYGIVFEKDGRLPFVLFQLGCAIGF